MRTLRRLQLATATATIPVHAEHSLQISMFRDIRLVYTDDDRTARFPNGTNRFERTLCRCH